MKPENKLSAAIGILLAGFFTAMVLRPDHNAQSNAPEVAIQNQDSVNSQLAYQRQRPYLPKPGLSETAPSNRETQLRELLELTSASSTTPVTTENYQPAKPVDPAIVSTFVEQTPALNTSPPETKPTHSGTSQTPAQSQLTSADEREHVVTHGDTLSGISLKYYGSVQYFDRIFAANRDQISSPNALQIGMKLKIPPLVAPSENINSSAENRSQEVPKPLPLPPAEQIPSTEPRRLTLITPTQAKSLEVKKEERSLFVPFRRIAEEQRLQQSR